jgi:PilZ domain
MFRKRQVPRVKLNVPAWIEVGNSALLERCTLIDLSEKGARLVVGDISHLTDHFCLYLKRVGHVPQRCRILWRRDHQVGVEFDSHETSTHRYDFEKAMRSELGRWMSVGLQGLVYDDVSMIKLIFAGPHDRCS